MILQLARALITRLNKLSEENKELKAKVAEQDTAIQEMQAALDQFKESANN
jgi:predicted RNase H-like nuclease (RuvC/YqgF family)